MILFLNCPDSTGCRRLIYAEFRLYTIGASIGVLYAINPKSEEVDNEIKFTYHNGLAYDGEYLWPPTRAHKIGKFNEC